MFLADAVVETHDRVVGRTYREATRACEAQLGDETAGVRESLRAFGELGRALLGARDTGEALDAVIADGFGWEGLGDLVAKAAALASTAVSDGLNHVLEGYRGKTKQIVISVKAGKLHAPYVRDLRGVMEHENAEMGVLLTLETADRKDAHRGS